MRRKIFTVFGSALALILLLFPIFLTPNPALAVEAAGCGEVGETCCNGKDCDSGLSCIPASMQPSRCWDCSAENAPAGCASVNPVICNGTGIDTAIGCIPVSNINDTAAFFLRWGMGIAGGLALILIIYASFLIITSAGNPKGVQAGKELLVSALAGLLFLIFGVFALRVIGVDILGIPGL